MKKPSEFSQEELETIRRRLHGKQLRSRLTWGLMRGAYVLACIAALIVVITLLEGTWRVIGIVIVAILSSGIAEVVIDWRYENYRQEWELANETEAGAQALT